MVETNKLTNRIFHITDNGPLKTESPSFIRPLRRYGSAPPKTRFPPSVIIRWMKKKRLGENSSVKGGVSRE